MITSSPVTERLPIGEATVEEIPQLCEMLGELFEEESDFMPDQFKQASGLRLAITSPDYGKIFVARRGSRVAGMINLLVVASPRQGGVGLLFEDLIVRREFRGQGLATQLLEHAFRFACKIGAVQATLLTEENNEGAMNLYRKTGFSRLGSNPMRLNLGRGM